LSSGKRALKEGGGCEGGRVKKLRRGNGRLKDKEWPVRGIRVADKKPMPRVGRSASKKVNEGKLNMGKGGK